MGCTNSLGRAVERGYSFSVVGVKASAHEVRDSWYARMEKMLKI
jgi:hypothetical protein